MAENLITTKEAAKLKGVTVKTVNIWAQHGRLPVAEVVPIIGARLFDPAVVRSFNPKAPAEAPSSPSPGDDGAAAA